jgi:hypothetical protein
MLLLRRNDWWCATIFLGDLDSRFVIIDVEPAAGNHWLDHEKNYFYGIKGDPYLIVDADGSFQHRQYPRSLKRN